MRFMMAEVWLPHLDRNKDALIVHHQSTGLFQMQQLEIAHYLIGYESFML